MTTEEINEMLKIREEVAREIKRWMPGNFDEYSRKAAEQLMRLGYLDLGRLSAVLAERREELDSRD